MKSVLVGLLGVATLASAQVPDLPQGDACVLLNTEQIGAVLGVAMLAGQPLLPSTQSMCAWSEPGGPTVVGKKVTVALMTAKAYAVAREPEAGLAKSRMKSIGDDAYLIVSGNFGVALSAKKGDLYFQVRVNGFALEKARDLEKALALQILSNTGHNHER